MGRINRSRSRIAGIMLSFLFLAAASGLCLTGCGRSRRAAALSETESTRRSLADVAREKKEAEKQREEERIRLQEIFGMLDDEAEAESTASAEGVTAALSFSESIQAITFEEAELPIYYDSTDSQEKIRVFYKNGDRQIPYVEPRSWAEVMNYVRQKGFSRYSADIGYNLNVDTEEGEVRFTRENGSVFAIDTVGKVISIDNYERFNQRIYAQTLMDYMKETGFDENGLPQYLQRDYEESHSQNGRQVDIFLADYEIDVYYYGKKIYIPLQTLADLMLVPNSLILLYNPQGVFIIDIAASIHLSEQYSSREKLWEMYYESEPDVPGADLIHYNAAELTLLLDTLYGEKGSHEISSFREFFASRIFEMDGISMSLKEMIENEDPAIVDQGQDILLLHELDDMDSYTLMESYYNTEKTNESTPYLGMSIRGYLDYCDKMFTAQTKYYPESVPGYEEFGDTAFVTVDTFRRAQRDYYLMFPESGGNDTIGLLCYAKKRIMREDSPIKNIVLDLSDNDGIMDEDAAIFTASWLLGEISIAIRNPNTGALGVNVYRADVNLDRQFDDMDSFSDKKLFCMISSKTYGMANLVASLCRQTGRAILIGQDSAGGTCDALYGSTAMGSVFQFQACRQFAIRKNGSYTSIVSGVRPDIYLSDKESFYNREALAKYLNTLM